MFTNFQFSIIPFTKIFSEFQFFWMIFLRNIRNISTPTSSLKSRWIESLNEKETFFVSLHCSCASCYYFWHIFCQLNSDHLFAMIGKILKMQKNQSKNCFWRQHQFQERKKKHFDRSNVFQKYFILRRVILSNKKYYCIRATNYNDYVLY